MPDNASTLFATRSGYSGRIGYTSTRSINPIPPMKIVFRLVPLFLLAVVSPLWAAFESIKVEVTEEPQLPAVLRMNGLTNGHVTVAIDVGPDGRPVDWLVLSASHRELIKPCVEALQHWRYKPARYDGQPVLAQIQLTIDLSQTGAVISRTIMDSVDDLFERLVGRPFDYQACPAGEVDRLPVPLTTVAPHYAQQAEKEGVRGRVKVYFYIDEKGEVRMPAVPADAHPYLSTVAIEALKGWKFAPPTSRGRPVLVAASQEFDFDGVR